MSNEAYFTFSSIASIPPAKMVEEAVESAQPESTAPHSTRHRGVTSETWQRARAWQTED